MAQRGRDIFQGEIKQAEPSLRDATTWWLADMWYGNDREGVDKARKFVNVLEQTPYGLATFVDDLSSQLGQGDYANAALTAGLGILPGRTPGIHISKHDFDKFDLSHIGKGEGTQFEGPGMYFTTDERPAALYERNFSEPTIRHRGGSTNIDHMDFEQELLLNSKLDEIFPFEKGYDPEHAKSAVALGFMQPKSIPVIVKEYNANAKMWATGEKEITQDQLLKVLEGLDKVYSVKRKPVTRYDVQLGVGKDDVPILHEDFKFQPKNIQRNLGKMLDEYLDPWTIEQRNVISQLPHLTKNNPDAQYYKASIRGSDHPYLDIFTKDAKTDPRQALLDKISADPVHMLNQYGDMAFKSPQEWAQAYQEFGIPGIQYKDPDVGNGEIDNYVMMNTDLIKILKKTALGIPGLLGLIGAMGEENGQQVR